MLVLGVGAALHPERLTARGLRRILEERVLLPARREACAELAAQVREDGVGAAAIASLGAQTSAAR